MDAWKSKINVSGKDYYYVNLKKVAEELVGDLSSLPFSMRVLLENVARHVDGSKFKKSEVETFKTWLSAGGKNPAEVPYHPGRVLMQDFTGVPAVVDLAAMRDAMKEMGGDGDKINPLVPVDLVIDHSVSVERYGKNSSFKENVDIEYERNKERYSFLKWGAQAFKNFRVVPPGTGICHQVNVEYLADVVWEDKEKDDLPWLYPDTLVGTDSHTTMINGLSVLGWGVGGIEAEAAMLGQPISLLLPEVVGMELKGKLKEGITATDMVLTVTEMLRAHGVVGKFVEFFGEGLDQLSLENRATLSNMAPEYGATCGFFPIDHQTVDYLKRTGRPDEVIERVETYAKAQGLWFSKGDKTPTYSATLTLDLATVEASLAGPKRPQDRISLSGMKEASVKLLGEVVPQAEHKKVAKVSVEGTDFEMNQGDLVIAAITSCTNTSNPSVLLAAGLVAKKARERGLSVKPWVKTSLAPGSQVVTDYLKASGLDKDLDALGFNLVGYGCTTCIGNSGPLKEEIETGIKDENLFVASVLSGNRNFEGRIHPLVKANYLASPPLVVAYALLGTIVEDLTTVSLGKDQSGKDVYLKDIWPTQQEVDELVHTHLSREMFQQRYANVFAGDSAWQKVKGSTGPYYEWEENSTYIRRPSFFEGMGESPEGIQGVADARALLLLGDSVTTDHISPAGVIPKDGDAGVYLQSKGVKAHDFNSFGSRRGNHEVMMRGTFANIRIKNKLAKGKEGGYTVLFPEGEDTTVYQASQKYVERGTPLVVVAGKEYGTGSSRDWAAKGTKLLGVKVVVAESYERIHRSNLVGMGVVPLQLGEGVTLEGLKLDGTETFSVGALENALIPLQKLEVHMTRTDGSKETIPVVLRIDTSNELEYVKNGGVLSYVLRHLK